MPAVVSNFTRIWEPHVYWKLHSQCGIWDTKGKGVDIWECIRDHESTTNTQPPNSRYWRYVTRR
ncbi:hypothetical protein AX15_000428 [Amanita polypyramis BW_CC]|nr:hypothetical protein AX15_000428 [Amanita polypyramis BW_CC]